MKINKILFIIVISLLTSVSFAQVGIGIDKISGDKNLDIKGGFRIGNIPPAYPVFKEDGTLKEDSDIINKEVDEEFLTGALVVDIKGKVDYIPIDSLPAFLKTNKIRYLQYAFPYDPDKSTPPGKQKIEGTQLEFGGWFTTAFFYTNNRKEDMEVNFISKKECYVTLQVSTNTQATEYTFGQKYAPNEWHFPAKGARAPYLRFKTKTADIKSYQFSCFVPDISECFSLDMYFSPAEWITRSSGGVEKKQRILLVTCMLSYPKVRK